MQFLVALLLLVVAVTGSSAEELAKKRTVHSGDFLVGTARLAAYRNNKYQEPNVYGQIFRFDVLTPTGKLQASIELPVAGKAAGTPGQTALSPDGEYAFTTTTFLNKDTMGIYVTRLKGKNPKVVRTLYLGGKGSPASYMCNYPDPNSIAPIAVGPRSKSGNYAIYITRQCFTNKRSRYKVSSIDILRLHYLTSTGKITAFKKKPFSRGSLEYTTTYSFFTQLRVIQGTLYGIYHDSSTKYELVRLKGNRKTTASASFAEFEVCNSRTFSIASPTRLVGLCLPYERNGEMGDVRSEIISLEGNSLLRGPPPPEGTYTLPGDLDQNKFDRYDWLGTIASDPKSSAIYIFTRDQLSETNTTLYSGADENELRPIFSGKYPVTDLNVIP